MRDVPSVARGSSLVVRIASEPTERYMKYTHTTRGTIEIENDKKADKKRKAALSATQSV